MSGFFKNSYTFFSSYIWIDIIIDMKNTLFYISLISMFLLINSCSDDNELNMTNNRLILIKVDYLTYNFESYYEIPIFHPCLTGLCRFWRARSGDARTSTATSGLLHQYSFQFKFQLCNSIMITREHARDSLFVTFFCWERKNWRTQILFML